MNRWAMAVWGLALAASAQVIDNTDTRVQTTLEPGLTRIGTLKPKSVSEIGSSQWTLGCETIDREYSDYHTFKAYLPPLGIKRIRLQGGWARTEKDPGIYDFAWLDSIVDDALSRGLEIWLETDYGNPAYPGGGGRTLAGGFPCSEAGLNAWDRWVEKMAEHYKGRVRDWAMWNEPDGKKEHTPERVTAFNIRTASIIKRVIPDARIGGLVLCGPRANYIEHFVKTLVENKQQDLFTWVVYHGYEMNPDLLNPQVLEVKRRVAAYAPNLKLWQGECGTQSEWCPSGALCKYPWTELTQAKWDARRMLGDIGCGAYSTVFTAADLDYRTTSFHNGLVRYGLIKTAGAAENFRVLKVKTAYYAVQNVVSVFNDDVAWIPDYACTVSCEKPLAVYGHRHLKTGAQMCVFWDKSGVPSERNDTVFATLTLPDAVFHEPVWVDTITGGVYGIPGDKIIRTGNSVTFKDIPVYDAPTFIAEKNVLSIEPWKVK